VRTDQAAVAALYAELRLPDRHFMRQVAPFPGRGAAGPGAVGGQGAYRQLVAAPGDLILVMGARDPSLTELCRVLGVPFTERMLAWPPGPRSTDGAWAAHWYDAVLDSTGFARWRPRRGHLSPALAAIHRECAPHYEALRRHRIGVAAA